MKTKKELKKEYLRMKPVRGVFQIRNVANNHVFIGCSTDINSLWNRQKFQLNFGSFPNKEFQKSWMETGEDNFSFEIVSELEYKNDEHPDSILRELKELEIIVREEVLKNGGTIINLPKSFS